MSTTFETAMSTTEKRERAESEATEGLDEQAIAKKARKDARVLRNRQSAQRSRNQRKNEMVYLQSRVAELEEENRRLREQSLSTASMSSPSTSTSSIRLATPEQQVMTLAGDLGLPPSLVSSGVKLSSVAPQQTGVESPVVKEESIVHSQTSPSEVDRLLAENRALVERVQMLETLVKHVVALSDLSGLNANHSTASTSTSLDTLALPQPSAQSDYLDFNSFVNPTIEETPSVPVTQISPELRTPTWSGEEANPNHPIACHSAAVATSDLPSSGKGEAQQRAKGTGLNLHPSLITKERLSLVARVVVASAKMRGWTLDGSSPYQRPERSRRTRMSRSRMSRRLQWSSGRRI